MKPDMCTVIFIYISVIPEKSFLVDVCPGVLSLKLFSISTNALSILVKHLCITKADMFLTSIFIYIDEKFNEAPLRGQNTIAPIAALYIFQLLYINIIISYKYFHLNIKDKIHDFSNATKKVRFFKIWAI